MLDSLVAETRTIVIYEAPHHLKKTIAELLDTLGDRSVTVAKELTKKHETFMKTTLAEAVDYYDSHEPRGEYILVIAGADPEALAEESRRQWDEMTVEEHLQMYMDRGLTKKDAIKQVASDRGVPKREIYNLTI